MQTDLLTMFYAFLTSNNPSSLPDLQQIQHRGNYLYPTFHCPDCKARLFDGWLFGKIRCWRCKREVLGRLDKFVEVLQNCVITNERL